MVAIEGNNGIHIHYAGAAKPAAAAGAVKPVREYKLAKLPELTVDGLVYRGFRVTGFQVPDDAKITVYLGERLGAVIERWPEAEQARAVRNLLAFTEENRPQIWSSRRGVQEALTELMGLFHRVTIGFDTKNSFDPKGQPQAIAELGIDMDFRALTTGGRWGDLEIAHGKAMLRGVAYDTTMPAKDLEAILRFQGE